MRGTTRKIVGLGAALVLGLAGAAQADPLDAGSTGSARAQAPSAGSSNDNRFGTGSAGFVVQRSLAHRPVQLYSPRADELWIVEQGADDQLILEHKLGSAWTTTQLPGTVSDWQGYRDIGGSAPNDVWLAAGNKLWHYDGAQWSAVATPVASDGADAGAQKVADVRGPGVFVGTQNHGVFFYNGSGWQPLGKPAPLAPPRFPGETTDEFWPLAMRFVGGELYVVFEYFSGSANGYLYKYANGQWMQLAGGFGLRSRGASIVYHAWLVPGGNHLIALGAWSAMGNPLGGACAAWPIGSGSTVCPVSQAVGGADLLPDGSIVMGGTDYVDTASSTGAKVPGEFRHKRTDGRERTLAGDPGDQTLGLVVEPGTRTAWAITQTGSSWSLQRWR